MASVNAGLEADGANYRVEYAEYLTAGDEAGTTVYFSDVGNKQLSFHWVPGDPRRGGATDITYIIDQAEASNLPISDTNDAINRAMDTWDSVNCSDIPITYLPWDLGDLGFVQWLNGLGGSPFVWADITHAGWIPYLGPNVLGVTFTFGFCDPCSPSPVWTDIDNNAKGDTAFREIYYNSNFPWGIDTGFPIDVETVALHEAGHGLSQAHFGKLFSTDKNGKFHFAPRALMNAGYTGVQQEVKKSDNGGHCSIWASWPNN
jgi:hypothetical protein